MTLPVLQPVLIFLYVAVIHTYRRYIPYLSKWISSKFTGITRIEGEKRASLMALQRQQAEISIKDEFAKYAKLDRKINRLTEEIKSLRNSQFTARFTISWGVSLALNTLYTISILWLIWTHRSQPIIRLPEAWCWPLDRIVSFPCGVPGSVGVTAWLAICSAVLSRIQALAADILKPRMAPGSPGDARMTDNT